MNIITDLKPELMSDSREGARIDTVVLHWTAGGAIEGSIRTLKERRLAYHVLIGRSVVEGVYKCIPYFRAGRHVGTDGFLRRSVGPNGPGTVNRTSIGISFANRGNGEPITDFQELMIRHIIEDLLDLQDQKKPGFALKWITTHHECAPRARPTELLHYPLEVLAKDTGLTAWRRNIKL